MMHEKIKLTDSNKQQIAAKFSQDVISLCDQYPQEILNAAEHFDLPFLPDNYIPKTIEIYYANTWEPQIFIINGKLQDYLPMESIENNNSISVFIDDELTYVEIENKIILDRLGGVKLPEVIIDPSVLVNAVLYKGERL